MYLNIDQIKEKIPHREPMLLISEIIDLKIDRNIIGIFNVNPEWDIFRGHFPNSPVLPGVFLVEAMAQVSDILILSTERYKGLIPYFLGINNVYFKSKVKPGDRLEIYASIISEREEKAIVTCSAEVKCGSIGIATGDITLAMRVK